MNVNEITSKQGKIDIELEVTQIDDAREFATGKVCNAKAKDSSGEITLCLWNDEIEKVKVGSKIRISNGYATEYQGNMQLSAGKFGVLEII